MADGEAPAAVRHIGIVLFNDVEELDAVGPWEVLAHWTQEYPQDQWAVSCLSRDGKVVKCAKGLCITPHFSYADAPKYDVLVYPGGCGTRKMLADPQELDWVRSQRAIVPLMTSVCTGSLVYAAAGLLAGRPATTYWACTGELLALDPSIQLRAEERFVDDGDVVTSSGVSAGIDMSLHLVSRLAGVERAKLVRRGMQYDPSPPV